jgi:type II secretory ATPase GspE/PulE/Tfp pilus assembly ATPase PilB-like protein
VILVGEVRDADTARIAVQSALTGHLVLSSLHGNDSVAALHRLLDMGIEAFLVASSVVGSSASACCAHLRQLQGAVHPDADDLAVFRQQAAAATKTDFFHGAGLHPTAPAPATATASACTSCCGSPPSCAA